MEEIHLSNAELFNVTKDSNNIVTIGPDPSVDQFNLGLLDIMENFASLLRSLLGLKGQNEIAGILYYCPVASSKDYYQGLFKAAKQKRAFQSRIQEILEISATIKTSDKPVVAIINKTYNSCQLAPMLWASHIIATENLHVSLTDSQLGIFPGLGVTVYASRLMDTLPAAKLLVGRNSLNAKEAITAGLVNQIAVDDEDALASAKQWILANTSIEKQKGIKPFDENEFEAGIAPVIKKTNRLFPGVNLCFELIAGSKKLPLEEALALEAKRFTEVLGSKEALGIMRTLNYGIQNAKIPVLHSDLPGFTFNKIGVLGAGMMGAGIAYEVARAGITVSLKDTDLALATKGKLYAEKCSDKLIQLGKMTESRKKELLALIHPTDKVEDLAGSDLIIEAVFEDKELKGRVIAESSPFLTMDGVFASNTTSLPITQLASFGTNAAHFIGMHFFSPVDKMPLVEIIRGKETNSETLNKAVQLALKLQKTPIIVHDSPAFFTSRIFFNYLLEAITMLLEGIPAQIIEDEALNAGFAVSPLAVLDEISIPLMLHVYDQLPDLSSSQKRCYKYLSKLVEAGRTGRKSGKGFYSYETGTGGNLHTGTKQIWQDETLRPTFDPIDNLAIQKRLLHVMALDSYRCLDEGVLDQPIDGDIGSILGIGYAVHTGGVISHIDQVGIQQFVKDCESFSSFGEQWEVPSSLKKMAADKFSFYKDFTSNWPLAK